MTKQVKNLKHLQSEIDSALSLINNKGKSLDNIGVPKSGLIAGTQSLLERCENVVNKKKSEKPVLRVIHHLACSGGTIFSKCIAAMPNVFLLSEAHPNTPLVDAMVPVYSPTDIPSLAKFAQIPNVKELNEKIFIKNVELATEHVSKLGAKLVIRYHSHSDFCSSLKIPEEDRLTCLMRQNYSIAKVLTIRDPLDAYSSLVKNGWVHFTPQTFDEYCRRYLLQLTQFEKHEIFRYEDFVSSPLLTLEEICKVLKVSCDDSFEYTFSEQKLTGDSGRKSNIIGKRMRQVDEQLKIEAERSKFYAQIRNQGWY